MLPAFLIFVVLSCFDSRAAADYGGGSPPKKSRPVAETQVPDWSRRDMEFFLHGSMSTEVVPETVLRAFVRAYPDLFPSPDFSNFGFIPDAKFGWPVGFSRDKVAHLGGLSAVGINCASCHVGEIAPAPNAPPVRVLGMTAQLDVETFLGSLIVATFRSGDPANIKKFLAAWLLENDAKSGDAGQKLFQAEWQLQEQQITAAISADPTASKNLPSGTPLHALTGDDLRFNRRFLAKGEDLAALSYSVLKLFHNMRAVLHVPDQPPPPAPPNGPGRNDPWRVLSYSLLGVVTEPAPVKFGIVWNEDQRTWVHVDGNTRSPIIRNLAASLGLGAPLIGHRGVLNFALVKRQTDLSERIRPPNYPWTIDRIAAERGAKTYSARCASCHDGANDDRRLYPLADIQTDPNRATIFTQPVADGFNKFFAELEIPGYQPPPPALRGTGKYWSPSLAGVWARAPYLHNGSVRTIQELLASPVARAKSFHRGSRAYDQTAMGYVDEGAYLLDTTKPGHSNSGHDYGADLSTVEKRDLIEYLKTL